MTTFILFLTWLTLTLAGVLAVGFSLAGIGGLVLVIWKLRQ